MKNIKTFASSLCIITAFALAIVSCKEEDPMLNSVVSPVLVDVVGANFGAPISATASVPTDSSSQEITVASRLFELDKTNILNNEIGIDSVPVSGIKLTVKYELTKSVKAEKFTFKGQTYAFTTDTYKSNGNWGELTSDANGLVSLKTNFKTLGFEGNRIQRKGDIIKVTWSGSHKGIAFTRFSQIAVTEK